MGPAGHHSSDIDREVVRVADARILLRAGSVQRQLVSRFFGAISPF